LALYLLGFKVIKMKAIFVGLITALFALSSDVQIGDIARGRYLTEQVANCQDCHTRHLVTGQLDKSAWLKGAILHLPTDDPSGKLITSAPDITSGGAFWRRWGDDGMLQLLVTGRRPDGKMPGSLMPRYKLRRDDAGDIVAHLKSLK
jgi:hypothetical protein